MREIFAWVEKVKFSHVYASNLANCMNNECCFNGLKNRDCYVFIQQLLPIAFRNYLPSVAWDALIEVSHFFQYISSTSINVTHCKHLKASNVVTLCNLENFPPCFLEVWYSTNQNMNNFFLNIKSL